MSGARLPEAVRALPRDKADTLLLLAAALAVLAPHYAHLPWWISALSALALLWRAALTWLGRRLPPVWLLAPLAVAAMAAVYLSYRTLLGRDAGVAMLVLLLAFKLLEMRARRDLFVVCFLAWFVLLTGFLYAQSPPSALLAALALLLLLTAQQSFQYTGAVPPLRRRLAAAARLGALAAPLAALLFLGFPRIQGPLWGLPGDAAGASTGLSDSMEPGSLSALAQSDEPAFRVRFLAPATAPAPAPGPGPGPASGPAPGLGPALASESGPASPPAQERLYWRSLVLGDYDGRRWTRVPRLRGQPRLPIAITARGQPLRYELTMEASQQRWLALLELAAPTLAVPGHRLRDTDELEWLTADPVTRRVRFEAGAYLDYTLQAGEQPERMTRWLALPAGYNPRTLALARTLRASLPDAGAEQLSAALLARFRRVDYRYTLAPPLLGRDAVDQFLFDTRAGFCEHYAGAYVVLLRAMGVPARVVTGYQGGELNPLDGYLTVRQSDAHAWAEFWTSAAGWRRADPTAAVAPERVQRGLARALPRGGGFGLGPLLALRDDPASWLGRLRFGYAALNNSWNQWVLDYNPDRQRSFLEELDAALDAVLDQARGAARAAGLPAAPGRLALVLALTLAALAALAGALAWLRRRRGGDPLERLYAAFCRQQARRGYPRAPAEGPHGYALRLRGMPATPAKHAAMQQFLHLYGMLKYGAGGTEPQASLRTLKTLLPLCR